RRPGHEPPDPRELPADRVPAPVGRERTDRIGPRPDQLPQLLGRSHPAREPAADGYHRHRFFRSPGEALVSLPKTLVLLQRRPERFDDLIYWDIHRGPHR